MTARSLASRSAAAAIVSLAIASVDKIMQVPVHCPASSQHSISVLSRVFRRRRRNSDIVSTRLLDKAPPNFISSDWG